MDTKLTVIIPVFNAQDTLPGALSSLGGRHFPEMEVIFIDDGSTDGTAELLSAYRERSSCQCKVLHQENRGAAAARNMGLEVATGEYLLFLDADDRFADGALDRIYSILSTPTDILGWDWIQDTEKGHREMKQAHYSAPEEALSHLMGGTMKWNLWLFAVKRALIEGNGIRFTDGDDMGEDMAFILKAFACASEVTQVHEALYRYNAANPASISLQMNERRRGEVSRNLQSTTEFLSRSRHAALAESLLPHLKLYIKRPLLISESVDDYHLWKAWFPEANRFAGVNKEIPLRIRILQKAAAAGMWWVVRLYNLIVYKLLIPVLH